MMFYTTLISFVYALLALVLSREMVAGVMFVARHKEDGIISMMMLMAGASAVSQVLNATDDINIDHNVKMIDNKNQ